MSKRWIVCDVNYLCWRNYHTSLRNLSHNEIKTGTMFGLFRDILTLQNEFATENIAFCFDRAPTKRLELFPEYKSDRQRKRNEMTKEEKQSYAQMQTQLDKLRTEYLPDIGFNNVLWNDGYEADDMIAVVTKKKEHRHYEFILVSADHDLYQCLSDSVSMYNPTTRKLYTLEKYKADWGLEAEDWRMVKAIAGCKSDGIPGVPGVGESTAAKFVRNELKEDTKAYGRIMEHRKQIAMYYRLVTLPFPGCPQTAFLCRDTINERKWNSTMKELGIQTLKRTEARFRNA